MRRGFWQRELRHYLTRKYRLAVLAFMVYAALC